MNKRNRVIPLVIGVLLMVGCQSPFLVFPGKALKGESHTAQTFAFAETHPLLKLEVNPQAPYSVILRTTLINEQLYVDAAPARKWAAFLRVDHHVRVALDNKIYSAIAVRVFDHQITDRFRKGREIYRLDPLSQDTQAH